MTPTPIPAAPVPASTDPELPPGLTGLPPGLTELDATRIAAALDAGRTASTLAVYASAWRRWERWCASRRIVPLPATPPVVCAYLTDCAARGLANASLDQACAAIGYRHRRDGAENPIDCELVRQVRRGLRRTLGTAPRRQARPLGPAEIRQILTGIDRSSAKGARDAALILLGFASALRRAELAALRLADIEARPTGLLLTVRRSKSDPEARGQVVGVAHGRHASTDPVAVLDAWITARGSTPGCCSPACAAAGSASIRSPATPSPGCSRPASGPPGCRPTGSPHTRCAPGTPPHVAAGPGRPGSDAGRAAGSGRDCLS